jgi:hypothetical protein
MNEHGKLLNRAAREFLRPLGLTQKGRSRTWLDDHGWWLGVVEFQPGFGKGSYLNVGATFLWNPSHDDDPYLSFDLGYRVEEFHPFEDASQFEPLARALAQRAADEARALRARLPDVAAAATVLAAAAEGDDGWPAWHAAIALGLAGRRREAAMMFDRVIALDDDRDFWRRAQREAERLQPMLDDEESFRAEIEARIDRRRRALKLSERRA